MAIFAHCVSICYTELPDFLSDDESEHIIDLAEMYGLENSIMHSDEFQEKHKKDVKGNKYFMSLSVTSRERILFSRPLLFHIVPFLPSLVPPRPDSWLPDHHIWPRV